MSFDRWIAVLALMQPFIAAIAAGAWRVFSRLEKRLDQIDEKQGTTTRIVGFHHQVLAWHDAAIDELEERLPA